MTNGRRKELWLVSFGDLVTLLVCLFVAMLAGPRATSSGRALAEGGGEHVLELQVSDFDSSTTELTIDGAKRLNQLKVSSSSRLTITGCDGRIESADLSRTLAVARQFSVTPVRGSVAFSDGHCAPGSVIRVALGR